MFYVYFLCCGTESPDVVAIKIGRSYDPFNRLASLCNSSGRPALSFGYMECGQRKRTNQIEHDLHKAFSAYRIMGEWYRFETKDKAKFAEIRENVLSKWRTSVQPMKLKMINAKEYMRQLEEKQKVYQRRYKTWSPMRRHLENVTRLEGLA